MINKLWLALSIGALAALTALIFYGWRMGSISLLPIGIPFC